MTVATGELGEAEAERVGLVPTHAYAVLQVRDACGVRLVQLKNPWAKTRWKGAFSAGDAGRWTAEMRHAFAYDPAAAQRNDQGIFWIDYASLRKFYLGVYLNWNPSLFRHTTTHHGQWPKRASLQEDDTTTLGRNPQYSLTVMSN
jgi:calpain-7